MIQTIFHWDASSDENNKRFNPNAHCLLRIGFNQVTKNYIVILSQLRSNIGNSGIGHAFTSLSQAIINKYQFIADSLPNVIWIQHYGAFSEPDSFENMHIKEVFVQISASPALKVINEKIVTRAVFDELLGEEKNILEPVESIIKRA
jgi:hypothetical protein